MSVSLKERFLKLFSLFKEDKLGKDNLDECIELELAIRSAAIFSSNEDASDLQTSYVKYLISDFLFASVLECIQSDRLQHLKVAQNYYFNFLNSCLRYDLISKDFAEYAELARYFVEDKDSDDVREERFEKWIKNVPRDLKIDRMKRIVRLKSLQNDLHLQDFEVEEDDNDNAVDCSYWRNWINCCILMCLDHLSLLLREVELLESGQDTEKTPQQPIQKQNDKLTKVEKPFKLVKDRKQIAADAFKYGHNLPTMTIDEYLDLERKRGNIITGGGAASAVKKEIDEDDEVAMELELMKAREFDEFKDMHARGSGNTYNRS